MTTAYFNKYDPDTNALVEKASVAGTGSNAYLAYDAKHQKFVTGQGANIAVFDPVTETISTFPHGVSATPFGFLYVAERELIYCIAGRDGLGRYYIGYLDLDLSIVVQLGIIPAYLASPTPFPYNLAYSPLTGCLYGRWATGLNDATIEFDLLTNICTHFTVVNWGGFEIIWDPDRDILVGLNGTTVCELEVVTKTLLRQVIIPGGDEMRWTPAYFSGLKKVYATGYDNVGDVYLMSYLCQAPYTVTREKDDFYYWGVCNLNDNGSALTSALSIPATVHGVRRLCLT